MFFVFQMDSRSEKPLMDEDWFHGVLPREEVNQIKIVKTLSFNRLGCQCPLGGFSQRIDFHSI